MRATLRTLPTGYRIELLEGPYAAAQGRTVEEAIERLVGDLTSQGYAVYWCEFTSAEAVPMARQEQRPEQLALAL